MELDIKLEHLLKCTDCSPKRDNSISKSKVEVGAGFWRPRQAYNLTVTAATPPADTMKFLEFKDKKLQDRWGKRKIPMHLLLEEFLADNIAFKGDVYEILSKHPAWTTTPVGL